MFKVKDLMIDVLARGGGGGAMMPTPTEPTPPSPISPVALTAAIEHRLTAIDQIVRLSERADLKVLDDIAIEIGRAVVGVRVAALCAQDMATCQDNERISPFAAQGNGVLRSLDFGMLHAQVGELAKWVDERGDVLEKRAVESKKDLVPRLEGALKHLK